MILGREMPPQQPHGGEADRARAEMVEDDRETCITRAFLIRERTWELASATVVGAFIASVASCRKRAGRGKHAP